MDKLTRFGSRFKEKISAAEALEEARRSRTPGQIISDVAETFETYEKVAQQLGRSFEKALNQRAPAQTDTNGWFEASLPAVRNAQRFEAVAIGDVMSARYTVTVTDLNSMGLKRHFQIDDEDLALHSRSVESFRMWIAAIVTRLRLLLDPMPLTPTGQEAWMSVALACEELESMGVREVKREEERDLEQEEREAIASILATSGGDQPLSE